MNWCLTKDQSLKFRKAVLSGEIDVFKIANLESSARREFLSKFVGQENAKQVNALYESKLLLKNQQKGIETWIKKVANITPKTKRDILDRVGRLETALNEKDLDFYLEDLVSQRLGIGVSEHEANTIFDLHDKVTATKEKMRSDFTFSNENDRLAHGLALVNFENYINELKLQARKPVKARDKYVFNPIKATPGVMKSLLSTLDNSFFGRQGIKTLYTNPTVWAKGFAKSFGDIARELTKHGSAQPMDLIKADIYSRPNSLNGQYKMMGTGSGLYTLSEEAFPSSLPGRVPLLGRLFNASETAFNGGALRMRAELADIYVKAAKEQGINTMNKTEAEGIGSLVGSMSGRSHLGKFESAGDTINVLLFSGRYLMSNIHILTGHQFDIKATKFTRSQARKNLIKIVGVTASVLLLAKTLDPDSVEEDPRSKNFGKVKVYGRWTDITGGMGSIASTSARVAMWAYYVAQGKQGYWKKTNEGILIDNESLFGKATAMDEIGNFIQGKFSPGLGILRDALRNRTYSGDKFSIGSVLFGISTPLSIQTAQEMLKDPGADFAIASIILEGAGLSTNPTIYYDNWNSKTSKEMTAFKSEVGATKFKSANDKYNKDYVAWFEKINHNLEYQKLGNEDKANLLKDAKEKIKQDVFAEYGFKYKQERTIKEKTTDKYLP